MPNWNIERLLSEVSKYPEIWDTKSVDNKSKSKKDEAWLSLCRTFFHNYDEMPSHKQQDAVRQVQNKWRNLRDTYVRAKKKGQSRDYIYAKYFRFLEGVYEFAIETKNGDNEETDDYGDIKTEYFEEQYFEPVEIEPPPVKERKRKRDSARETTEFIVTSREEPDDDSLFFESLRPFLREFNWDQKLLFRREVLEIARKVLKNHQGFINSLEE